MLIEGYELDLCDTECAPEARGASYSAKAQMKADISKVMPYLNAVLDRAEYGGDYQFIVWRDGSRAYALRPYELAVSAITDRREAEEVIAATVAMINDVWERRESIEPRYEKRSRPAALEVFRLLPGNNCGECGFATCMAFAVQVAAGDRSPADCPSMMGAGLRENLTKLHDLLA